MSTWGWIAGASVVAYLTKVAGYLLPRRLIDRAWVTRASHVVTIGLLSSLVVVNTVVAGPVIVLDARLVAVVAAGVALWVRAPYLAVVVVGAAAAALARWTGLAP